MAQRKVHIIAFREQLSTDIKLITVRVPSLTLSQIRVNLERNGVPDANNCYIYAEETVNGVKGYTLLTQDFIADKFWHKGEGDDVPIMIRLLIGPGTQMPKITLPKPTVHNPSVLVTHLDGQVDNFVIEERKNHRYWNVDILKSIKQDILVPWHTEGWIGRPAGALFHGPPGTGKTKLAEIIMKFFVVTGSGSASRFFSGRVGETEEKIRSEAAKCKQYPDKMCCMFIDEFESLGGDRDTQGQTYKADFLNQLLAIVGSNDYPNLFLLAATNFRHKLDSAVVRDGRISLHYFIGPLSRSERIEFLHNSVTDVHKQTLKQIFESNEFKVYFENRTINFTAAQMASLRNDIYNSVTHRNVPLTKGLVKDLLEKYLDSQAVKTAGNLIFNRMSRGNNRSLFRNYDRIVSEQLALQLLYPPATGSFSGRIMVSLIPEGKPTLELELCKGLLEKPLISETFTPQFASSSSESILFDMLQPIITLYDMQYVQVLNRDNVHNLKDYDLSKVLQQKVDECIDCKENSMIIIMVDDLIGSASQISLSNTNQIQHSSAKEFASVISETDIISKSLNSTHSVRKSNTTGLSNSLTRAKHMSFTFETQVSRAEQNSDSVSHGVSQGWVELGDEAQRQLQETLQRSLQHSITETISKSSSKSTQFSQNLERTLRQEVSTAIDKSVTRAMEVSSQSSRQRSVNSSRSFSKQEQATITQNFQPLYPHNLDSIVTFAKNINFNQKGGPCVVFVVRSKLTQIALQNTLSWGSLDEPQHSLMSIRIDHVTKPAIQNINERQPELEYLKILPFPGYHSNVQFQYIELLNSLKCLDVEGINFDGLQTTQKANEIIKKYSAKPTRPNKTH